MVTPTVSIFLWLLPSNFAGHFYCSPNIWNQLIKRKVFWILDLWMIFGKECSAIFFFFLFSFSFFLPFSLSDLSFLSLHFFCVWKNKRPRKWWTYGATCFELLTPKPVPYCFLSGEHNVINSLVLCGCTGLFPELKVNALEVLSCPRTVSAGIYLRT